MTDDPDLSDVVARELRLQDPDGRNSRSAAAELLDPEFHEFGASGRIWDRDSILDLMAGHHAPPPLAEGMVATRLSDDVVHLTYRTRRPGRTALRSSLWCRRDGGPWRVYFHQGTVRPDNGPGSGG